MDTSGTPTLPRRRSRSGLRLFLLSVAVGFCISFGGSLVLATQISVPEEDEAIYSELVRDAPDDEAPSELTPLDPSEPLLVMGGSTDDLTRPVAAAARDNWPWSHSDHAPAVR